jgi:S-sulfosulfanyl-L-cysteine sulfohydrolase
MSLSRREFIQLIGMAAASGMAINSKGVLASPSAEKLYDIPKYGNVHLLHFTDCHAQLNPIYFREPTVNLGVGQAHGRLPHLVGEKLLNHVGIKPNTPDAYAFTSINFEQASLAYGKVGGFSHLATLVKRMKQSRPGALLLDGGDTWQGSATALWTKGQDMVDACLELGVDVMTAHWEMTLGDKRVKEIIEKDFKGKVDFVAQNIKTADFGDPVFNPYVLKEMNGISVAIIGQAFPYTPIAHPRHFVPDWTFGIQEENMQNMVDEVRSKGAGVVVVLSHNGMDVDIKLASRIRGIDAIMGGHTHDGMPVPVIVENSGGKTLVTNAGSNSKFLGVLDFDVINGNIRGYKYRLLPVFSNFLPADSAMENLISKIRSPFEAKLNEKLAVTQDTLYRRGNFNGTFDQVIVEALMEEKGAEIAFSPGFRWGTSLLPNSDILMENLMDQTATTYSYSTLSEMTGGRIKTIMEDIADNLFNPDPYYQQGGDMVRVGGMSYAIEPNARMGSRIQDMRLNGKLIEENKIYKVAGWAPVAEGATGEPVWDVVANWLRSHKTIPPLKLNTPRIIGMDNNPGKVG